VPTVTLAAQEGRNSAAWILEHGAPVTVVLVGSQPIGAKSAAGDDVHALTLTVATGVDTPYQVQVGNGVPASALPLLFPGSRLHARVGDGPNDVVVDWAKGAAHRAGRPAGPRPLASAARSTADTRPAPRSRSPPCCGRRPSRTG